MVEDRPYRSVSWSFILEFIIREIQVNAEFPLDAKYYGVQALAGGFARPPSISLSSSFMQKKELIAICKVPSNSVLKFYQHPYSALGVKAYQTNNFHILL